MIRGRAIQVAVIGPSECAEDEAAAAEEIGSVLAVHGATLISGGLGGVMEASCRGARVKGGLVVGILPDYGEGNPFLSVAVRTGLSHTRNFLVVGSADSIVAVGGAYGTLSEIAIALTLGKPVFGLNTWDIEGVEPCTMPEEAALKALSAGRP
ncbi:MAG TPA: TIGR00725 family protein [Methanolinea sp.]|nr:TIGR00725 family protein [Methanolinea sp.]HQK55541.1 TIGR00725 family protein [Methanolinea sp.]